MILLSDFNLLAHLKTERGPNH